MKKILEQKIRRLIQESLLLEAKYQFRNLLIFKETIIGESNLFDEVNNTFIQNGGTQHDLNNPKSAGRFFIDVLFECMEEIKQIIDAGQQDQIDISDRILTICNYIIFLFEQKEVTSKTVQSGQTFKDYILNFMTYYSKTSYPGTTTIFEKLQYVFRRLNEKSTVSSLDAILKEKNYIKSEKETLYPFGKDTIVDGYIVVCPLSVRSSIFWARTNWLAKDIVLPAQEDISWCTARFKGGNMFNTYFAGGGTNLFYFLPEGDVEGKRKFCIGITKVKHVLNTPKLNKEIINKRKSLSPEDFKIWEYEQWKSKPEDWTYMLTVGGHTTVDFANKVILKEKVSDFSSKEVKNKLKTALNISDDNILNQLEKEMLEKEPVDNEKYVSLLDVEQFAASTNINNLAPINPDTGKRDTENLNLIEQSITSVIKTYNSKIYRAKGYVPDEKIVNYIDKNYVYWQKEGVDLDFYIPIKDRNNKEAIIENIKNYILQSFEESIQYKKVIDQVSPSLQNDPDIFKLCFFENIMKRNIANAIFKDFNIAQLSDKIENVVQLFEETFAYVKIEFQEFFDNKMQAKFSSSFFKFISEVIPKLEEKIKKLPDEKLIDLFFEFKEKIFLSAASHEYYLNNPRVLLKIADFSNKNSLPSFLVDKSLEHTEGKGILFGRDYLVPKELLSNKDFILKLIELDKSCVSLLRIFRPDILEDKDVISVFLINAKKTPLFEKTLKCIFDNKNKRKEIVTYDFLKRLCDKNILCFYQILHWSKFLGQRGNIGYNDPVAQWMSRETIDIENFKNSSEQTKNASKFVIDFLSNDENIYSLIFSYQTISNDKSPASGLYTFIWELSDAISNTRIYSSLQDLHQKITSDFSLFRKVISFEKKKLVNNPEGNDNMDNLYDLTSLADPSIEKNVEQYIHSNVIIESKKNKKLIMTESQLRRLISSLL